MSSKIQIEGYFPMKGSQLIGDEFKILIVKRDKTTPSKPSKYLLAKLPDGSRHYISSLYTTTTSNDAGLFEIEYLGTRYNFQTQGGGISITKKG